MKHFLILSCFNPNRSLQCFPTFFGSRHPFFLVFNNMVAPLSGSISIKIKELQHPWYKLTASWCAAVPRLGTTDLPKPVCFLQKAIIKFNCQAGTCLAILKASNQDIKNFSSWPNRHLTRSYKKSFIKRYKNGLVFFACALPDYSSLQILLWF